MVLYGDEVGRMDPEEFLFDKKNSLDHFFIKVYEELS